MTYTTRGECDIRFEALTSRQTDTASVRPTVSKTTDIAGFPNFAVDMSGNGNAADPTVLGTKGCGFRDDGVSEE